ncbi:hypothetical protein ACFQUU_27135 [Herbaspirillum sp. GCM10030257]|uniref:hypothetical protein n=1 Tax=Herbaspirillum sp. GCM10030257 TaxID=3273393 RepID=UPI00361556CA
MAGALGSLVVKLALEYAEFTKGLSKSDQDALKFAQNAQRHMDTAKAATSEFFGGVLKGAVGAAAAYVGVTQTIDGLRTSIDGMDAANKMASRIGISTDAVQKFTYIGALADVGVESLSTGFKKLSVNMLEAAGGSKDQAALFKGIGVEVTDAAGNIRDSEEVMNDIADVFASMDDGATKTALAVKLFGKAGTDMIPALNGGKEALKQASDEAVKYGLVIDKKVLPGAEQFNDNLSRLGKITEGTFNQFAEASLPVLALFTDALVESASGTDSLNQGAQRLKKDGTLKEWAVGAAKAIGFVGDAGQGVYRVFEIIGKRFGSLAAAAVLVAQGEFKAAGAALDAFEDDKEDILNRKLFSTTLNEKLALLDQKSGQQEQNAAANDTARKARTAQIAKLLGEQGNAAKKASDDYDRLNKSIQERIAMAQAELAVGKPLSAAEKELAKLTIDYEKKLIDLSPMQYAMAKADLERAQSLESLVEDKRNAVKMADELNNVGKKEIETLTEQVTKQREHIAEIGLSKEKVAELAAKKLELAAAADEELASNLRSAAVYAGALHDTYVQHASDLEKAAKLKRELAAGQREGGEKQSLDDLGKKAADDLDKFLDPTKAVEFGDALQDAFKGAGNALNKLTSSLDTFGRKQSAIEKARADALIARLAGKKTEEEYLDAISKLNQADVKNQLRGYGDMAGAAATFFNEQSSAYRGLMAVSQAFHAAELAMTIAETVPKAINAVLNQSNGDPYTAFGRMAAMAAVVAGLGVAIGGGGGKASYVSAADRQKQQGTGTVLGDEDAKSKSLEKATELLANNSNIALEYSSKMLSALRSIDVGISGMAASLSGTAGVRGTYADQVAYGVSSKKGFFGWGSKSTTLEDSGIVFDRALLNPNETANDPSAAKWYAQSIGDILASGQLWARGYGTVKTTKSNWFGSKESVNDIFSTLKPEFGQEFIKSLNGMFSTILSAGTSLGGNGGAIDQILRGVNMDDIGLGKVSLMGKSGTEVKEILSEVLSAAGDAMAEKAMPMLSAFNKVGEGMFETLIRVSSGVEAAQFEVEKFGLTAVNYADVVNKQGDVGAEIVRQTIVNSQRIGNSLTGVGDIMSMLDGSASDLAETYGDLLAVQGLLTMVGIDGNTLGRPMIRGARDLESLNSGISSYFDNYFTDAEKVAAKTDSMRGEFAALGLTLPTSTEGFRTLVDSIDKSSASGQVLFGQLMLLADGFAELTNEADQLTEAQNEAKEAQKQTALDAVSDLFGALETSVNAQKEKVSKAFEDLVTPLNDQVVTVNASISKLSTLSRSLQSTLNSMRMPSQLAVTRASAIAQLETARSLAKAGGVFPDADSLSAALGVVAQPAEQLFATFEDYQRDFVRNANTIRDLSELTDSQLSIEQQTLKSLNRQIDDAKKAHDAELARLDGILTSAQAEIDALNGVNTSVQSVTAAIAALNGAIVGARAVRASAPAGESGTAATVAGLYGKFSDSSYMTAEGQAYWAGRVASGESMTSIEKSFQDSVKVVRGYASGGYHPGGLRLVGENGPELEVTGPSTIYSNSVTNDLLSRLRNPNESYAVLVAAMQAVQAELRAFREQSKAGDVAIAQNTSRVARQLERWDGDGLPAERDLTV